MVIQKSEVQAPNSAFPTLPVTVPDNLHVLMTLDRGDTPPSYFTDYQTAPAETATSPDFCVISRGMISVGAVSSRSVEMR